MQVDFGSVRLVTGVVTQSRAGLDQWVTSYRVLTSLDCLTFDPYKDNRNNIVVWVLKLNEICLDILFFLLKLSGWQPQQNE